MKELPGKADVYSFPCHLLPIWAASPRAGWLYHSIMCFHKWGYKWLCTLNSLPLGMLRQIGMRVNKRLGSPFGHLSIGITSWVIKIKSNNNNCLYHYKSTFSSHFCLSSSYKSLQNWSSRYSFCLSNVQEGSKPEKKHFQGQTASEGQQRALLLVF